MFFYKFNCTDPGLQLGDPAPLIGLLLWFLLTFKYSDSIKVELGIGH